MFNVNTVPREERERITNNLLKWGISIDQETGKIDYIEGTAIPEVKCESIHLIRHAETEAVIKHEFMSDTSDNCGFTENGIEITRKQAEELDNYNFDVALYGPIARVVNTMQIIMERPQKFEAVRVQKLHGIDNTGWEYKSFYDLENDPIFIAREIENNMFARTPNGTSWGTVIANCDTYIYLGGNDLETAEAISRRCDVPLGKILYMPVGTNWIFRRGQKPVNGKNFVLEPFEERLLRLYKNDKIR